MCQLLTKQTLFSSSWNVTVLIPKVIRFVRLSKATYVLFIDGTHSFLFQLERGGPTSLSYLLRTSLRQLMCQSLTNQSFCVVLERDGTGEGIDYISQCIKIVFLMLTYCICIVH